MPRIKHIPGHQQLMGRTNRLGVVSVLRVSSSIQHPALAADVQLLVPLEVVSYVENETPTAYTQLTFCQS